MVKVIGRSDSIKYYIEPGSSKIVESLEKLANEREGDVHNGTIFAFCHDILRNYNNKLIKGEVNKNWNRFKFTLIAISGLVIHPLASLVNMIYCTVKMACKREFSRKEIGKVIFQSPVNLIGLTASALYGIYDPIEAAFYYHAIEKAMYGEKFLSNFLPKIGYF